MMILMAVVYCCLRLIRQSRGQSVVVGRRQGDGAWIWQWLISSRQRIAYWNHHAWIVGGTVATCPVWAR